MKYIGIDQYGHAHKLYTDYPRKELIEKFGVRSAKKIYRDTETGCRHVGYVVCSLWISLYACEAI